MLLPWWQMEWPQVNFLFYVILSSEVFNRTSSQMCGRWYFPMFLFRDGLLTLIYRASLMVLIRFWSSLPTILKIIYANLVTNDLIMVIYGGWDLLMFLEPLSKCSGRLSYIFFITLHPFTFISVDDPTFLQHRIFVLRGHQEFLIVTPPLK